MVPEWQRIVDILRQQTPGTGEITVRHRRDNHNIIMSEVDSEARCNYCGKIWAIRHLRDMSYEEIRFYFGPYDHITYRLFYDKAGGYTKTEPI